MTKKERGYYVAHQDLLMVVYFVKHHRHYLCGRFFIRMDHGALKYLFNFKNPLEQIARWLQFLKTYTLDIEPRPGKRQGHAGAMLIVLGLAALRLYRDLRVMYRVGPSWPEFASLGQ